jgi:hypothetical protein
VSKVNRTEKDPLQRRLEATNWILLAVLLCGGLLLQSGRFVVGILCGGLISIANFHGLYRNLVSVFTKHLGQARPALLVRYYLRLTITAVVLFIVISRDLVDVIGLAVGLSVVVLNIILTTVLVLSREKHA